MKKLILVCILAVFLAISSNAFAGDYFGGYRIDSATITPPAGGVSWSVTDPADLVVGNTYTVEMHVSYDQDLGNTDVAWNTLLATLTFNNSGASISDDDNAGNVVFGSYAAVVSAQYDFTFAEIIVSEAMLNDTSAAVSFSGTDLGLQWHDIGSTGELPVQVSSAPVPEPATMLLLGVGILGIIGISKRKIKAKAE